MSDDFFGLKKRQRLDAPKEGVAFTFEERAELFDDLLEDDASSFPLLEAPHEVLAVVGSFLEAKNLAALGELCTAAHLGLDEAFSEAWTALLLRDYMPRSRAKRYRAYGSCNDERRRLAEQCAGVVLTAVDISRVEWDGLLVAAPPCLRYRFLQSLGILKTRWGRLAQSWEWFVTRAMHRMTYSQLMRVVPDFKRHSETVEVAEDFDEVAHQASMDRNLRQRQKECNPNDVIASMKRSLGLAEDTKESVADKPANAEVRPPEPGSGRASCSDDVLSAMAPTARDQRLQEAERLAILTTSGSSNDQSLTVAPSAGQLEMPSREDIERMPFSEQLELALRISQTSGDDRVEQPQVSTQERLLQPCDAFGSASTRECAPEAVVDDSVLLRLKAPGPASVETIDVVLQTVTAGEGFTVPAQIRRSLEQMALRLTREDWLLLYESIAIEAQLRARTAAHHFRSRWLSRRPPVARRLVDLEAEMLRLPIFRRGVTGGTSLASGLAGSCVAIESIEAGANDGDVDEEATEDEHYLHMFVDIWKEHEAWATWLEEHLEVLDLEVNQERTNNLQQGRAHTPYVVDLLRLAFRNFAICEGRLFFALALAAYDLITRVVAGPVSDSSRNLLETLYTMAKAYGV